MPRHRWISSLAVLAAAALFAPSSRGESKPVEPPRTWRGSVEDERLMKGFPAYVACPRDLEKLWTTWKIGDQAPEVDFSREIVVLTTTRGSRLQLVLRLDDEGNLEVGGLATRDLRPGFRYVVATVSREGIRRVNGEELPQVE